MIAVGKRVFIAGKEVFFVGVGVELINKCVIDPEISPPATCCDFDAVSATTLYNSPRSHSDHFQPSRTSRNRVLASTNWSKTEVFLEDSWHDKKHYIPFPIKPV